MSAPTSQDVYNVLLSIDRGIKQLLTQRGGGSASSAAPAGTPVLASVAIADDKDLDSQYGDETIRFEPRDWSGVAVKGSRMSECPPEFLDMLADTYDYFARKNAESNAMTTGGKPKAEYDRRSAARARGWAARLRSGWQAPAFTFDANTGGGFADNADDGIPFAWLLPLMLPALGVLQAMGGLA